MTGTFSTTKFKIAIAAALATFVSASASTADTLTFGGWSNGYQSVDVTAPGFSDSVAAGEFVMEEVGGPDSFSVFCLDLIGVIYSGVSYDYETTDTPFATSQVPVNLAGIQNLFNSGYATALASSTTSAAFQVALWNTVYDGDWDVTVGDFIQSGNAAVTAQANTFLAAAEVYTGPDTWSLSFFEGQNTDPQQDRSQNLVTAAPSPVPLPASGVLLLAAFGGLALQRRRKAS